MAEPGLSILIEIENKKILFDTGYSDVFIKNANKLNISLENLTDVVISHGHNEHTRGLCYLNIKNKNIKFTAHPSIFDTKIGDDKIHYGCPITKKELGLKYELNLTKKPYFILPNLLFLGQIENNNSADIDDSALVYISQNGLYITTDCSHSGILEIINYAKKMT